MTRDNSCSLWQAVRANNQNVEVQARSGTKQTANMPFVLLHDVQDIFPGASRFLCGKRALGFMVDTEGNKLHPLRIPHMPETVLEVVMADTTNVRPIYGSETKSEPRLSNETRPSARVRVVDRPRRSNQHQQLQEQKHELDQEQQQRRLRRQQRLEQQQQQQQIQEQQHQQQAKQPPPPLPQPQSQPKHDRQHRRQPSDVTSEQLKNQYRKSVKLYQSFLECIQAGQTEQANIVKEDFRMHFRNLEAEMARNQDLQKRMVDMQESMLKRQQEALDRLALIQNGVQAILIQNFELHEYPLPRLFIVLPKDPSRWDSINIFQNKFRLHFLCECGEHTKSPHSEIPHHVHLTKHDGYELERPSEFSRRYGGYVLKMLQMLKYGVSVAGFAVPAMLHMTVAKKELSAVSYVASLESEVNQAIEFLQAMADKEHLTLTRQNSDMGGGETLEGADIRRVRTFLKNKDENNVLGNLYRIMNSEGHVKWVCIDHYRDNYNMLTIKELEEVTTINSGVVDEHHGRVEISLSSPTVAAQFYKALERVRTMQEIKITLEWDISFTDANALKDALLRSSVVVIELTCTASTSASEYLNRKKRAEPLWEIMSRPKLQLFSLSGYTGFFKRVGTGVRANDLGVLKIAEEIDWKKDSGRVIDLLKMSPHLTELCLGCTEVKEAYQTIRNTAAMRCPLTKLTLEASKDERLVAQFETHQTLVNMELVIPSLSAYNHILQTVDCISSLRISGRNNSYSDCEPLLEIIRRNRGLAEFKIACYVSDFSHLYEAILNTVMTNKRSSRLKKLCLYRDENRLYTSDIRMPQLLTLELMQMKINEVILLDLLKTHGSKLTKLKIDSSKWRAAHSAALLEAVGPTSATNSSTRLTHLYQTCADVDETMLTDLSGVINRSNLTEYQLIVDQSFRSDPHRAMYWIEFIHSIGLKLTSLYVICPGPNEWIEALGNPKFPAIEHVSFVRPQGPLNVPQDFAHRLEELESKMAQQTKGAGNPEHYFKERLMDEVRFLNRSFTNRTRNSAPATGSIRSSSPVSTRASTPTPSIIRTLSPTPSSGPTITPVSRKGSRPN